MNLSIKVQAKWVVQPPFIESVSSIPIQIVSLPISLYINLFLSYPKHETSRAFR